MMKKVLNAAAVVVAIGALVVWVSTGSHVGWTKTSVPVKKLDEVTGIEGIEYHRKFLAGVDFLAAALLASGILAGLAILVRSRNPVR